MTLQFIRSLLQEKNVNLFLNTKSKEETLKEIAEYISLTKKHVDKMEIFTSLREREAKASTGAEYGVAFPHAFSSKIEETELFIFISREGIPFESFDKQPAKIFFVILSPKYPKVSKISNLNIIANVCRIMKSEVIRNRILAANNLDEILLCLEPL